MSWETALVTGASSGIGRQFAQQLAAAGTNLVLVARSDARLHDLARALEREHGVGVEVLAADLTKQADLQRVAHRLRASAGPVDLIINNAGFGTVGALAQLPLERELDLVRLNVMALLHLSRVAAEAMQARGRGSILNVGSLAGYMPIPYFSVYAASKAFVVHLTLALREELRGTGVSVTVLAPGFVDTKFVEKAGVPDAPLRGLWAGPARVAAAGLAGAARGQATVFPSLPVRLSAVLSRVVPPSGLARAGAAVARTALSRTLARSVRNASRMPAGPPPHGQMHIDDADERSAVG